MGAQDLRPRFYEGQFLSAADLEAATAYPRNALARHALGGHTWGIVCGLTLLERPAPGAPDRVELLLQPGFAVDGFGRHVVVERPQRIAETLFAAIPFAAAVDDPPPPATAKGRLVKLWIGYDEVAAAAPSPGFEPCGEGDTNARVQESFRLFAGEFDGVARQAHVTVGTETVAAEEALQVFDPAAMRLYDGSVPHQRLPAGARPPRWLLALGVVRWIARDGALGYLARLDLDPSDNAHDRARALRRYAGIVAQNLEAADGVVVVHRRGENPMLAHRLARLLASGGKWDDLKRDLLWVEGDARVVGNARLAAGALQWRNGDGLDEGTPIYLARHGDGALAPGNRELRAVIGGSDQIDNRLVVGPQLPGASPPDVAPRLVVTSGAGAALGSAEGRVGVNLRDPEQALHVAGDRIRLADAAAVKRIELRCDGAEVALASDTSSLHLRAAGAAPHNRVLINAEPALGEGAVGIGTAAPAHGLDVKQDSVRFDFSDGNAGQLVLRGDTLPANADRVYLEAANAAGNAPAAELRLSGPNGTRLPLLAAAADVVHVPGALGIGTANPQSPLHVMGSTLRVQGLGNEIAYLGGDGIAADVQLGSLNVAISTVALYNPTSAQPMDLRARHLLAAGRVGVGTFNPTDPLQVEGDFASVRGVADERAVIGGEGHGAVVFGTRNALVGIADMRRLNVPFDAGNDGAWLTVWCRGVTEVSDAAAKTDVRPLGDALERVLRLRGVRFVWRSEADQPQPRHHIGLIAQEVQQVVPEAVSVDARGAGLSYSSLVPLLVESVKSLKGELDALRAEVAALRDGATPPKPSKPSTETTGAPPAATKATAEAPKPAASREARKAPKG
jgi:hypothetical protein